MAPQLASQRPLAVVLLLTILGLDTATATLGPVSCPRIGPDLYCEFGFVKDDRNCDTCKCLDPCSDIQCENGEVCDAEVGDCGVGQDGCPPVTKCLSIGSCSPIGCDTYCAFGYEKDQQGCEICTCADPCLDIFCEVHEVCQAELADCGSEGENCTTITSCIPLLVFDSPSAVCPYIACDMYCEFGFIKYNGCDMCSCLDPCSDIQCEHGEFCKAKVGDCGFQNDGCPPVTKCLPIGNCSAIRCDANCEFGYEKDQQGCEICTCTDPCLNIFCQVYEVCQAELADCGSEGENCTTITSCIPLFDSNLFKCLLIGCRKQCEFGFIQDDDGCDMCSCLDPCSDLRCENGEVCEAKVGDCGSELADYCPPDVHCASIDKTKPDTLPVVCNPIQCMMYCEFGFVTDHDGCDICSCLNPCSDVVCGGMERCVAFIPSCFSPTCPPQTLCAPIDLPERCTPPPATGPCRAAFTQWFFNMSAAECQTFTYGGCQGNENNFDRQEVCARECKKCPVVTDCEPCLYGYRNIRGCPTCDCFDPCASLGCAPQMQCTVHPRPCDGPTCPPPEAECTAIPMREKAGLCPVLGAPTPESPGATIEPPPCGVSCQYDIECHGDLKCCPGHCGDTCMKPEVLLLEMSARGIRDIDCETHLSSARAEQYVRHFDPVFIPRCTSDGLWAPMQCRASYGVCWCVHPITGGEQPGTRVRGVPDCSPGAELKSMQPVCPPGQPVHVCSPALCGAALCPAAQNATCRVNPCGGCTVDFYTSKNEKVICEQVCQDGQTPMHCGDICSGASCGNHGEPVICYADPCSKCTLTFTDLHGNVIIDCTSVGNVPEHCKLPPAPGQCPAAHRMWYFDPSTSVCRVFNYGGCEGNDNRFNSEEDCKRQCTGVMCGGKPVPSCSSSCKGDVCSGNPAAQCSVDPCSCEFEFYDLDSGLQVRCDVDVQGVCSRVNAALIRQQLTAPDTAPAKLYSCDQFGNFARRQCDEMGCYCMQPQGGTSLDDRHINTYSSSDQCYELPDMVKTAGEVCLDGDFDTVVTNQEAFKTSMEQQLREYLKYDGIIRITEVYPGGCIVVEYEIEPLEDGRDGGAIIARAESFVDTVQQSGVQFHYGNTLLPAMKEGVSMVYHYRDAYPSVSPASTTDTMMSQSVSLQLWHIVVIAAVIAAVATVLFIVVMLVLRKRPRIIIAAI